MSASFHTASDRPPTLALRQLRFGHRVTQRITTAARGAQRGRTRACSRRATASAPTSLRLLRAAEA
jgi:hypothetical protein